MHSIDHQILIIGAGASGLSAAYHLEQKGVKPLILEARDTFGGRIRTTQELGFPCDFGASFIHGTVGNVCYDLARENDIPLVEFDYETPTVRINGNEVDSDEFLAKMRRCERVFNEVGQNSKEDMSILEAAQIVKEADHEKLAPYVYTGMMTEIEAEYGAQVSNLSAKHFNAFGATEGPDWVFPEGYIGLFKAVSKGFNFEFGWNISQIEQNKDHVTIKSTSGKTITAKYVICTVPLGVLKKRVIEFLPPLPEDKLEAIDKMGFSTLDKMFLIFDKVFWPDTSSMYLIDGKENLPQNNIFAKNLYQSTKVPALILFIPPSWKRAESDPQKIYEHCVSLVRNSFPESTFEVLKWHTTDWASDPFTWGSYSSFSVGSTPEDVDILARREGRVLFAGEHTNLRRKATVQGAWLSGIRVANELLQRLSEEQSS